ncbi:hypothetical protein PSN45_005327 [Yamadazyma tenuis]|uniref:L domain-like protein n=1 Tax=Candida tenuis (strain ATCC 10573 / BCRC 21748 / CBS 615 / JCM 9827 / NBRC 10315 / NRRL Y-1498 / VKM Y-70) TaxID=590646 RepID=G3B1H4_CANTC|nr:uncharacterized protein CANTEDRAFT_134275 [Yamadazyma tenuis ATCC 10573]EGV64974.1 hypothetical protein CANTEDRAFT_134275 [Yamadazyma tenuis ATCC 10573]WEJ97768.1 hypothetical protein PSN45_005327 [Yamadazyma tenuis]
MGTFSHGDGVIEGDVYVQKLSSYIKRNEENLANGLLMFSKSKSANAHRIKPSRLSISLHHLYYLLEKIENSSLGVDIGPLNIRLDNPNHEPTFISFMANNARSSKHFDSDARSITSISSMKSIVSTASVYWRNLNGNMSKDPKVIVKDIKYLYSSFTKLPCLIITPKTKINSISGYEEYPCDTSVPIRMFKNLQVLEIIDYDPNEIFGWHILSDQLRILVLKGSKISDITEFLFNLVIEDETGRSAFNPIKAGSRSRTYDNNTHDDYHELLPGTNSVFKQPGHSTHTRHRSYTSSSTTSTYTSMTPAFNANPSINSTYTSLSGYHSNGNPTLTRSPTALQDVQEHQLGDSKWSLLRQLSVMDTSITSIPSFAFRPLANLVKLNLSNNLLESIPEGLDQLINVKYINFAENYITNLQNLPRNLKHLTTLNFNNNKLKSLEGLQHLQSLQKIDLRKNNLDSTKSLKPILYLFIQINDQFNNVYLNNNKLPKSFRIDLFNLINGIKSKNNFKIDDSRPGYFESALLLDNEAAVRNLHNFFKSNLTSRDSLDLVSSLSNLNLHDDTKPFIPLSNNQNVTNVELGKLTKSTTNHSISDAKDSPTSVVTQVQVTARMST